MIELEKKNKSEIISGIILLTIGIYCLIGFISLYIFYSNYSSEPGEGLGMRGLALIGSYFFIVLFIIFFIIPGLYLLIRGITKREVFLRIRNKINISISKK